MQASPDELVEAELLGVGDRAQHLRGLAGVRVLADDDLPVVAGVSVDGPGRLCDLDHLPVHLDADRPQVGKLREVLAHPIWVWGVELAGLAGGIRVRLRHGALLLWPCPTPSLSQAATASRIVAATASGLDTLSACDAPGTSRVPLELARSARNRCNVTGMFRSSSPSTNHDGRCFHAGVSVGSPSERAAWVTGRCVVPMRAA